MITGLLRFFAGRTLALLLVTALTLPLLLRASAGAQPEPERLLCASSEKNLWFVLKAPQADSGYLLCHHASDLPETTFKAQVPLAEIPEAMGAWGDRIWMAFRPDPADREMRREVFTLRVEFNAAFGVYYSVPSGRLEALPALPGWGKLAGLAGTARGPVALLMPGAKAAAGVNAGDAMAGSEGSPQQRPQLLTLQAAQWVAEDLPEAFERGWPADLAAGGEDGSVLIASVATNEREQLSTRHPDGTWSTAGLVGGLEERLGGLVRAGRQVVAMRSQEDGQIGLGYVRSNRVVPIMEIERPPEPWRITGLDDGLALLRRNADGVIQLQRIRLGTATVGEPQILSEQVLTSGKIWHISLAFAVVSTAMLLVFLIRPANKQPVSIPKGWTLMSPGSRICALLIDLIPGAFLSMLIFGSSPAELLRLPILTMQLSEALPYMLMCGIGLLQGIAGELIWGRSLGKFLLGARVISQDGGVVRPLQVLLRNTLKSLVLLIPPMALFGVLNNHLQGLGDLVARTVVVVPEEQEEPGGSSKDR